MGIGGLWSYMQANPKFFDDHQLHDGSLVIDGSNLACHLYNKIRYSCAWGGDYDKYARIIAEFFDDLAKCGITPWVIGDGGREKKKMDTNLKRANQKLDRCERYNPLSRDLMPPLARYEVFYSTLKKKGVKVYQSFFEADATAAALAKILGCPVLSADSDFYIFDVIFIPLDTLNSNIVKNADGRFIKNCKIFRPEKLFKEFPGLGSATLPLVAILLGNDYIEAEVFANFVLSLDKELKIRDETFKRRKFDSIFKWLSNYNLETAIKLILEKLPSARHDQIINIIEKVVNEYRQLPYNIYDDLPLEDQKVERPKSVELFAFRENANKKAETIDEEKESLMDLIHTLPAWFCTEYKTADLPKFFINMRSLRSSMVSIQVEDLNYPSVHALSVGIIKVIDGLLVAQSEEPVTNLEVTIRKERKMNIENIGEPPKGTKTTQFPALQNLRSTDIDFRKKIIKDTLEVTELEDVFEDVPPQWTLYLMTIQFWAKKAKEPKINQHHILAILTSMLFNVIDEKIGYYRSQGNFKKDHQPTSTEITAKNKTWSSNNSNKCAKSLEQALGAVSTEDCLLAAPSFIFNFSNDRNPKNYNVTIVHVFTQFQSVCKYVLHLNSLLGRPYEEFSFSEMFNGVLLYNFYKRFERCQNDYHFVPMLQKSPTLQKIVDLLFTKIHFIEVPEHDVCEHSDEKPAKRMKTMWGKANY